NQLWENVVSKKLAITGGIGARRWRYGEAFGLNYELPNMKAYNETCASIGNVFWNHRMFLLHGDAKYIDVLERILYNGLISGISFNGNLFFYPNPLASKGSHKRSPWFTTACCPTNLTRFIPSIPGYVYAQGDDILYVNLFIGNIANISLDKEPMLITQETDYPWNGNVKIKINLQNKEEFTIAIRIPGWSQNKPVPSDLYSYINEINTKISLKVNGEPFNVIQKKGFVYIKRKWTDGDTIEVDIPMPIRRVIAHEMVKNNNGRVALERGPIVYCVEWSDNNVQSLFHLFLEDDDELKSEYRDEILNGIVIITGNIHYLQKTNIHIEKIKTEFLAIPYYSWAHRGKGEMTIWMLRDLKAFGKSLD
ncbi:MAG: glycoside hydrolase family 127 protein, partial [Promethearchaeota archaeon]